MAPRFLGRGSALPLEANICILQEITVGCRLWICVLSLVSGLLSAVSDHCRLVVSMDLSSLSDVSVPAFCKACVRD
jgi:hypothetical protein